MQHIKQQATNNSNLTIKRTNLHIIEAARQSLEYGTVKAIPSVRFDDFENLPAKKGEDVFSPEFTCFHHKWCLSIFPGVGTTGQRMVWLASSC